MFTEFQLWELKFALVSVDFLYFIAESLPKVGSYLGIISVKAIKYKTHYFSIVD
jgi:hypothetical protein